MTEADWLTCTDPQKMLEFLRGKANDRKLRLIACACCRRFWSSLPHEPCRKAIEGTEAFADGAVSKDTFLAALRVVRSFMRGTIRRAYTPGSYVANEEWGDFATYLVTSRDGWVAAEGASKSVIHVLFSAERSPPDLCPRDPLIVFAEERAFQADHLRDVFGPLPFRTMTIDPLLLAWNEGTVGKIAQAIYDDRAFDRLPVLADALEKAGCHDPDILGHCRHPGPHVRGCWVVDLILKKN
jgi:hypothetical protein